MHHICLATGTDIVLLDPESESQPRGTPAWRARIVLTGERIQCLAGDPSDPHILYAGSHGNGVWKSHDKGVSWERLDFPENDVFSLAVSPADGKLYAGTEPSMLFVSDNQGRTWNELPALKEIPSRPSWSFPPRPWTSHVRWIAPHPRDGNVIVSGIELGGVMISRDGGKSWTDHPTNAVKDCHALAWHPTAEGRLYETGGGGPAAWSKDSGFTWERLNRGIDRTYGWGLAVDPDDPDQWYISASPGARYAHSNNDAQAYIYRFSPDGSWKVLSGGLPQPLNAMPYALEAAKGIVYAGLSDGTIYVSTDQGESWEQAHIWGDGIRSIRAMTLITPTSAATRAT